MLCLEQTFCLLSLHCRRKLTQISMNMKLLVNVFYYFAELFYIQCLPAMSQEYGGNTLMLLYSIDISQL